MKASGQTAKASRTNNAKVTATAPIVFSQDWLLFALRWGIIVVLSLAIYLVRRDDPQIQRALLVGAGAAALMNILFVALISFPATKPAAPYVVIAGDWVMTWVYVNAADGNLMLAIGIVSVIIVAGILRLGALWGALQGGGTLVLMLMALSASTGQSIGAIISANNAQMLLLLGMVAFAAAWSYFYAQQNAQQRQALEAAETSRNRQASEMQNRTRAIYDMSSMLSGTLNYQKILDAMLDVGRMSLRSEVANMRITSMVLLYQAGASTLRVATSRGLRHTDEHRTTEGKEGIIGKTLHDCMPTVGKDALKDPELQAYVAFADCKSLLCIPLRAGYDNYGVLVYGCNAADAFTEENTELLTAISTQATIALQNAVLYGNLLKEKERIVEVEEEARKKLARDLHDGPTQTISAIAMRMSYVYRLMEREPEKVPAELRKVEDLARNTTKEIRHLLFGLRPLVLESSGLAAALDQLALKMKETYSQNVAVRVGRDIELHLSPQQQGTAFYLVEEAVNNARKHAEAQLISVNVWRKEDYIYIQISDNGVGFDLGAVDANYDKRGSFGMVNMRERTELLGGQLRIDSAEGKGTTITITVPLKEKNQRAAELQAARNNGDTKLSVTTIDPSERRRS
jgi:signal transduction histidine kinase